MLKITGSDRLHKQLNDAQKALEVLDGQIASVTFNPSSAKGIQLAIEDMEAAIDAKVAPYRGNILVEAIIPRMKAKYREAIQTRAISAGATEKIT